MANTYVPKNYNTDGGDTSVFGGTVQFTGLPTSDPGDAGNGQLWNDSGTLKISPVWASPVNTVESVLSGTAEVGETLTVTNGTWTGVPAVTNSRQWLADGVPIAGATGLTYDLTPSEAGKVITVRVTGTNAVGSVSVLSNASAEVAMEAPENTVAPALTGTAEVGQTLTVTNGTWTGIPAPTYERVWLADDEPIEGEDGLTYELTSSEEGKVITVEVTATNVAGSAMAVSNATAAVASG